MTNTETRLEEITVPRFQWSSKSAFILISSEVSSPTKFMVIVCTDHYQYLPILSLIPIAILSVIDKLMLNQCKKIMIKLFLINAVAHQHKSYLNPAQMIHPIFSNFKYRWTYCAIQCQAREKK